MADDDQGPQDDPLVAAVRDMSAKLETVAGAVAVMAASHTDLLDRIDHLERRTEDQLAAVRDAAATPVTDLQALLQARADRDDSAMQELTATVEDLATNGPAAIRGQLADLREAIGDPGAPELAAREVVAERLEEVSQAVHGVTGQLSEIVGALTTLAERLDALEAAEPPPPGPSSVDLDDQRVRLTLHMDTALAGILRLIDDRLAALRRTIEAGAPTPAAGFEAGAMMGVAQAAWVHLEQRLDTEFDDLGRQLQAMASLVEQATVSAEAAANRPVVTGDQIRRAAAAMRDSVISASRSRRERRGGSRPLGPGPGSGGT